MTDVWRWLSTSESQAQLQCNSDKESANGVPHTRPYAWDKSVWQAEDCFLHGNTYPYNSVCNNLDLSSGRFNADGKVCDAPEGEYWRFIVDLVFPTEIYRLNTILGSEAFYNVAMQVHLEDGTTEGSPIRAYVQTLMNHDHYRMRQWG